MDHNVYTLSTENHDKTFIALYVYDLLIFIENMMAINKVKEVFSHEFDMKDLGKVEYYVGIQVIRDKTKRTINLM